MKMRKRIVAVCLVCALTLAGYTPQAVSAASKKVKLNKNTASVKVGKTIKLKVKNTKKKVKWSIKSGKKYISLKNKKKTSVTVKAKKAGTAKVMAKVGKKKLTCKIKVSQKAGSASKSSGNKNSTKSEDQKKVTGTPGKNIALSAGATAFNIGTYKLALGIGLSDVNTILGSLSTDVKRIEKSPQGFTAIAFNPSGSYQEYMIIYLKNDVVVGICGIGKTMSYGEVSAGMNGNLLPSGWSIEKRYNTSLNTTGAYNKTIGDATVLAYVNALGDNAVYCIQAFQKNIDIEDMVYSSVNNTYDAEVLAAMGKETAELINAYRVFYGDKPCYLNSKLANCAQEYCSTLTSAKIKSRDYDVLSPALLSNGVDYLNCGEVAFYGCGDAISFVNSMIGEESTYPVVANKLSFSCNYIGIGTAARSGANGYNTYLIIDYCDEI